MLAQCTPLHQPRESIGNNGTGKVNLASNPIVRAKAKRLRNRCSHAADRIDFQRRRLRRGPIRTNRLSKPRRSGYAADTPLSPIVAPTPLFKVRSKLDNPNEWLAQRTPLHQPREKISTGKSKGLYRVESSIRYSSARSPVP